ncbi:MAG TPA: acVLRF1 family peptidyl-tRNA hydrolase [Propionibacteriaceae bacterium]|nr:acVLRF1 family peptidyl-tRNA hydrolase [Propionibacteriaceae bacterium]
MLTGDTRSVTIAPARLAPWLVNFTARHGDGNAVLAGNTVRVSAADGAEAAILIPFPPLAGTGHDVLADLQRHATVPRRVGAVLVRKGGYAVGVFEGRQLIASKVGSTYVQGKTKAGGWSQQRYARRRNNQSSQAYADAAEHAVRVLLPHVGTLVAVATGGDRPALAAVLADPRLSPLNALVMAEVHPVPDPRLRVLQAFPDQFLAVRIELNSLA